MDHISWIRENGYGKYSVSLSSTETIYVKQYNTPLSPTDDDYMNLIIPFSPAINELEVVFRVQDGSIPTKEQIIISVDGADLAPIHLLSALNMYGNRLYNINNNTVAMGIYHEVIYEYASDDNDSSGSDLNSYSDSDSDETIEEILVETIFIEYIVFNPLAVPTNNDITNLVTRCINNDESRDSNNIAYDLYDNKIISKKEYKKLLRWSKNNHESDIFYETYLLGGENNKTIYGDVVDFLECVARGVLNTETIAILKSSHEDNQTTFSLKNILKCIVENLLFDLYKSLILPSEHYLRNAGYTTELGIEQEESMKNVDFSKIKQLHAYTTSKHDYMNYVLRLIPRNGNLHNYKWLDLIMLVNNAPAINRDIVLYRGGPKWSSVSEQNLEDNGDEDIHYNRSIGSYTYLKSVATKFVIKNGSLWVVTIPKGTRLLALSNNIGLLQESEVLLPRGTIMRRDSTTTERIFNRSNTYKSRVHHLTVINQEFYSQ